MKNIVATLVFFVTTLVVAQTPISKSIGEFSTLKVYDLINVKMIKSDENKVEISGDNARDVVILNKNGTLKIRMKTGEMYDGNNTKVTLYYTTVDVIDANEGADIRSEDTIQQFEIELKAQEGGRISLNIDTKVAEIRAVTGGIIELEGSSNNQDIRINTGGIFKGKDLKTTTTRVAIRAGGEAEINASELADIKIRAGGDVYVYGDPNTVNESRALGGRVKRM